MRRQSNVSLKDYSSLRVGGTAKALFVIETEQDAEEVCQTIVAEDLRLRMVGGGTNTFYADGTHEKMALVAVAMNTITQRPSNLEGEIVVADAGVLWDDLVSYAAEKGLWGLEALAGIPGTVGAAPVQNIGAYGSDVAQTIEAVEVFNITTRQYESIPGRACGFGYRSSIFNTIQKGRYIILRVRFWLFPKRRRALPKEYSDEKSMRTPKDVSDCIRAIRAGKIPDYHAFPSCGSYFKNPFVSCAHGKELLEQYPNMPHYTEGDRVKIPAGWILEQVGYKGKRFGHVSLSEQHALILTTDGKATADDVLRVEKEIVEKIEELFHIRLEREPEYVAKSTS